MLWKLLFIFVVSNAHDMLSPGETEREKKRRRKRGGKRENETDDRKRLTVLWRRLPLPVNYSV